MRTASARAQGRTGGSRPASPAHRTSTSEPGHGSLPCEPRRPLQAGTHCWNCTPYYPDHPPRALNEYVHGWTARDYWDRECLMPAAKVSSRWRTVSS